VSMVSAPPSDDPPPPPHEPPCHRRTLHIPAGGAGGSTGGEDGADAAPGHPYVYAPTDALPTPIRRIADVTVGRLAWGHVHETTGLLAVLNWALVLAALHPPPHEARSTGSPVGRAAARPQLLEIGLCPWEVVPQTAATLALARDMPLLGASPDAVLVTADGTVQVVEVKSHFPFAAGHRCDGKPVPATAAAATTTPAGIVLCPRGCGRPLFRWEDPGPLSAVQPLHIPQLQMEMACLGPLCRSALLVSVSASKGVALFRVDRSDSYIGELLRLIAVVHARWGKGGKLGEDFSWRLTGFPALCAATKRLAAAAVPVALIEEARVQRSPALRHWFWDTAPAAAADAAAIAVRSGGDGPAAGGDESATVGSAPRTTPHVVPAAPAASRRDGGGGGGGGGGASGGSSKVARPGMPAPIGSPLRTAGAAVRPTSAAAAGAAGPPASVPYAAAGMVASGSAAPAVAADESGWSVVRRAGGGRDGRRGKRR
jgi:hypothetical protein